MSIKTVDPNILALLSSLIAIDLAQGLDLEEQNVAGNFIIDVGQILLTMAAAEEAQKKAAEEKAAKEKEAEEKEAEEKAKEAKGKEKPEAEAKSKEAGKEAETAEKIAEEDEFIGRRPEELEGRLAALEDEVRHLRAALAGEGKRRR